MITIDSRAGSGDMKDLFPKEMEIAVGRLDFGDFFFLGNGKEGELVTIGVERKAIKDLLNSMVTGRFSGHQLPGLVQQYNYVYLLVEGSWRFNPDSGIMESQSGAFWFDVTIGQRRFMAKEVVGFLNTLAMKAGIQIVYSHDRRESVQTICALYHWWNVKQWDQHISHLTQSKVHKGAQGEVNLTKPPLVRRVAAELAGIGWGKSKGVGDYFPSVLTMALATEREWRNIPGIGKGIAASAVRELQGEE